MVNISAYNNGTAYRHSTENAEKDLVLDADFDVTRQTFSNFQSISFANGRRVRCRVGAAQYHSSLFFSPYTDDIRPNAYEFIPDECVCSLKFNEASSSDNYALGETCSASITLKLCVIADHYLIDKLGIGTVLYPFIVVNDSDVEKEDVYCPLGVFYIHEYS